MIEANPIFDELLDVFLGAVFRPSTVTAPNYERISDAIYSEIHSVLTGDQDAFTALEYMER